MNLKPVFFTLGILLTILSATMVLPALIDLALGNEDWKAFTVSNLITAFVGVLLVFSSREESFNINMRQAFLLTNLSWFVIALFGSLPFMLSDLNMSMTNAFFESMSGITTTGSTVIVGLDYAPPGILIWRAILEWLGGVGIIIMALSVLPMLQVGGMQLFKAESYDMEKVLPSAAQIATHIGVVYILLTLICAVCYHIAGMNTFDALAHAMTTIATGGYSTHDKSIGYFDSAAIDTIAIIFMLVSSLPFVLYLHAIRGHFLPLLRDTQVRWFIAFVFATTVVMTGYATMSMDMPFPDSLRYATFNYVSLITGTGYATTDYNGWGSFALSMAFFVMCVGGCAGSTTCGIKIFRFQVLASVATVQIKKLLSPHGVFEPYYNGKPIPRGVPIAVMSFFFLFALSFTALAITLQIIGLDFLTAMSGAATAISNVGPALGPIIGPTGTFEPLPDAAKWVLCAGMLIGRLEIFTLLVMLHPHFWRR